VEQPCSLHLGSLLAQAGEQVVELLLLLVQLLLQCGRLVTTLRSLQTEHGRLSS
jgi:hypothetical protein